jgi:hypothetical protein
VLNPERCICEADINPSAEGIPIDLAGPEVQNDRGILETSIETNIGDASDPKLVQTEDIEALGDI